MGIMDHPYRPTTPPATNHCGVVINCDLGVIEEITAPSTLAELSTYREKVISNSDGAKLVTIVAAEVGSMLRPNMRADAILQVMESLQAQRHRLE
jgi:hypothetical protein